MKTKTSHLTQALLVPALLSLAMWIVYKLDVVYKLHLFKYGVLPRTGMGLRGILTTPLIHDTHNNYHVFENTLALLFFGTLVFYFYRKIAARVVIFSWVFTQLLVWALANPVYHVGMSGVIYSFAFFLITGSIIRKNRQLTGVLFLILFLYGSIFWGLFPLVPGVSWESHLYGALTGLVLGIIYRKVPADQVQTVPPIIDDPADDDPNAWWKTGVIEERVDPTIHYHYIPKDEPDDAGKK
ncbi:MAG TPA: rhomboid family intramembrane serine protease [Flavobacteriales bacterium]|nr:rhomboid family intramembrane serine protease [Flavobacteriales bacterium]